MPTALPDTAITTPDTPVTLPVLGNDSGTGLEIVSLDAPTAGTAVVNADGTVTYTPNAGVTGTDSFTYTVRDAAGATASATVTIAVALPNRPPVAHDDVVTVAPGTAITIDAIANDNDPDGDPLRFAALDFPPHGNVSASDGQLRYRSEQGFSGTDSFAYTVSDGRGGIATAVVRVDVAAPDQAPLAQADNVATPVGTPVAIDVLANDSDPEGRPLTLVGLDLPAHGTLAVGPGQQLLYTPADGFEGIDRFAYTVADPGGATASGEVTVQVEARDDLPVAVADAVATEANAPVLIDLLGNDSDPESRPLTLQALTLPINGLVEVGTDQRLTYTPAVGFIGTDSFTYTVANSRGHAASAVVTVTVTPPATPTTFLNGYACRRRIVVPRGSAVGATPLEGFPLMVAVTGDGLKAKAQGGQIESTQGFDIRFEQDDGTRLDHEIERFDPEAGELRAWVTLQSLDPTTDTSLLLYYGKPGLTASEVDPANVWRDYLGVWHLPDGRDRTGRGRDLRTVGTVTTGSLLGDAAQLDGAGVFVHDSPTWLNGQTALSCQLLIAAAATGTDRGFLAVGPITAADSGPGLGIRYDAQGFSGGGSNVVTSEWQISDGRIRLESQGNLQTTAPQRLAVTWTQGGPFKLYADGAPVPTSFLTAIVRQGTTQLQGPLQIGAGALDSAAGGWRGLIDEVRFRPAALDAGWLATEHANQADPDAFMGMGGEDAFADTVTAPIGLPVTATTTVGTAIDIDVLATVGAAAGATVSAIGAPAHGTAAIQDGKVRYTPAAAFSGTDHLAYTVTLGTKSADGRIGLTVTASSTGVSPVDDKPWGGLLYGNPTHGDTVSNTAIKPGEPTWLTFPVERTGSITGVAQILRAAFSSSEIHNSPGDYSQGDGGRIRLQIRPLDDNGQPTSTVLGQTPVNNGWTSPLCVNGVAQFDQFALWSFASPVPVTRGQKLCFYWVNEGGGWISIDYMNLYSEISLGRGQHAGVYYGDDCRTVLLRSWGEQFVRDSQGGYWDVRYADGKAAGNPYWFATGAARKSIGGALMARQTFTVTDYTRIVDGLWFRTWWSDTSTTNLIVRLEASDGSRIEQLSVPRASISQTTAYTGAAPALWTKVTLAQPRTLELGKTYYLRFSTASGSYGFHPQWVADGSMSANVANQAKSRNRWLGSYAQYSTDGGATWKNGWDRSDQAGNYQKSLALSAAFTVKG